MRKLLFYLRHRGIKKFTGGILYYASPMDIKEWSKNLPWYNNPDCAGNGVNNYNTFGVNRGVYIITAKLDIKPAEQCPAIWLLNITNTAEELDFELIHSPSRKRLGMYPGSWINHKNSYYHDPEGSLVITHWNKRYVGRRFVERLQNEYCEYAFELTDDYVRWYIDGLLMAEQKLTIREPLYVVLSRVNVASVVIKNNNGR